MQKPSLRCSSYIWYHRAAIRTAAVCAAAICAAAICAAAICAAADICGWQPWTFGLSEQLKCQPLLPPCVWLAAVSQMFIFASGRLSLISHISKVASSLEGCFDSCRGNIFSYLRTVMHFSPDLTGVGWTREERIQIQSKERQVFQIKQLHLTTIQSTNTISNTIANTGIILRAASFPY